MKITFNLENIEELSILTTYAKSKGYTIDQLIDGKVKKAAIKIGEKPIDQVCSKEEIYNSLLDQYTINDFVKEKLKFKYILRKDATAACIQFGKVKELKYSFDTSSGDAYLYLLKDGCPNKADIATLSSYSIRLNLEELYNKIYGDDMYEKHVQKLVYERIEKSQAEWKARRAQK